MQDGRAVERGSHAELLDQDGLYARLVRSQALGRAGRGAVASRNVSVCQKLLLCSDAACRPANRRWDERPHHDNRVAAGRRPWASVGPTRRDRLSSRQRSRRASRAKWVLLLIVLMAAAGAATYWYLTKDEASTDDAYTDGRAITVAPQVAGTVVALHVTDNQRVKAGDLLLEIDPRAYVAARDQAQGSLQVAEAQLANARINLEWAQAGVPRQAGRRAGRAGRGPCRPLQGRRRCAPPARPAEAGHHAAGDRHRERRAAHRRCPGGSGAGGACGRPSWCRNTSARPRPRCGSSRRRWRSPARSSTRRR